SRPNSHAPDSLGQLGSMSPGWSSRYPRGRLILLGKQQVYPPVLLTFILDLAESERADLAGIAHMRPAAGLQVDITDTDQPHAALAHRRLDVHGLDQLRIGRHFCVANPLMLHRMMARRHGIERHFQRAKVLW